MKKLFLLSIMITFLRGMSQSESSAVINSSRDCLSADSICVNYLVSVLAVFERFNSQNSRHLYLNKLVQNEVGRKCYLLCKSSLKKPIKDLREICAICFDPICAPAFVNCAQRFENGDSNHCFHLDCLNRWLEPESSQKNCPVCRRPLKNNHERQTNERQAIDWEAIVTQRTIDWAEIAAQRTVDWAEIRRHLYPVVLLEQRSSY